MAIIERKVTGFTDSAGRFHRLGKPPAGRRWIDCSNSPGRAIGASMDGEPFQIVDIGGTDMPHVETYCFVTVPEAGE